MGRLLSKRLAKGLALAGLVGAGLLTFAYVRGNPTVVSWLCRVGLPNTTIPDRFRVALHRQPCQIYGKKIRVNGIWAWDGFETSGFFPYKFVEETLVHHDLTWPGISLELDAQSDPDDLMAPHQNGPFGGGKALVTIEGWPSVGEGRFGHLGAHDQQILVDRIVSAAPPPKPTEADYKRWKGLLNKRGH